MVPKVCLLLLMRLAYLHNILLQLRQVSEFVVSSQVVRFGRLGGKISKDVEGSWGVSVADLPQLVDSGQWQPDATGTEPILNFVLVVPSDRHFPLRIRDTAGNR